MHRFHQKNGVKSENYVMNCSAAVYHHYVHMDDLTHNRETIVYTRNFGIQQLVQN